MGYYGDGINKYLHQHFIDCSKLLIVLHLILFPSHSWVILMLSYRIGVW